MSCKVTYEPRYSDKKGHYFRGRIRWIKEDNSKFNHSEHFQYESDAVIWVRDVKKAINNGDCILRFCSGSCRLEDLIKKTLVVRKNDLSQQEQSTIRSMLKYNISKLQLKKLTTTDVVKFAIDLGADGARKPQTVSSYISYLGNVLRHAKEFTGIKADPACVDKAWRALREGNLVDDSAIRDRVISDEEDKLILAECERFEALPRTKILYAKIYRITLAQSLRRSALVRTLRRKHINFKESLIKVEKQQNRRTNKGKPQWCPMLPETRQVLIEMGFGESDGVDPEHVVFPFAPDSVSTGFRRILKNVKLEDIQVFRDGRRTAITNLDREGLSPSETRDISTHSDRSNTLEKVYLQSDAKKLAKKLSETMPSRKQKAAEASEQELHQKTANILVDMLANCDTKPDELLHAIEQVLRQIKSKGHLSAVT